MLIETNEIKNALIYGELLRNYCFLPDGAGDYGCYSTFILRPEFKRIEGAEAEAFIERFLRSESFWGNWYKAANLTAEEYEMQLEMLNNFLKNIYSNGELFITWYWDGDGMLIIGDSNKMAINPDCKCDYTWDWAL